MKVLILHGPNLNALGTREPDIYGAETLEEINRRIAERGAELGLEVECFQSNHEGALIDLIHARANEVAGIIINPAAFTHYGLSLRDALGTVRVPVVEVHISNIYARSEEWRHHSVVAPAVWGQIAGFGWYGYLMALDALHHRLSGPSKPGNPRSGGR